MNKKKFGVLIVGNFLSGHGGHRGMCEELASNLSMLGWQIFTTSAKFNRICRFADMLFAVFRMHKLFKVAIVDVFSGLSFLWAEATCWGLRALNKNYILTLHGGNLPSFASHHSKRVCALLNGADVVTAPSSYLQEKMAPYHSGIQLIPNPITLRNYEFRLRGKSLKTLIWVRSFHEVYNPILAVQVMDLLSKDISNLRLIMIGRDKRDGSLQGAQKLAEDLCLSEKITFIKGVTKSEIPSWLNKSDIFLNTSNIDNTPVSVLEAMASGLCIVSTNVGGIPYLIQDKKEALLVPPSSPIAMANAIRNLLTSENLSAALSLNSRHKAEEFAWDKISHKWEELLYRYSMH